MQCFINDENKGCGAKGLDFNSGWNWTPINHLWLTLSKTSGRTLSGDIPEKWKPFSSKSLVYDKSTSYLCRCLSEISSEL